MSKSLPRYTKSASKWTKSDLTYFNITVNPELAEDFFEINPLPHPATKARPYADSEWNTDPENHTQWRLYSAIYSAVRSHESAVDCLGERLLEVTGFGRFPRFVRPRPEVPFLNGGTQTPTKAIPDLCVYTSVLEQTMMLVQENKNYKAENLSDVIPQLVAQAIAAYDNNRRYDPTFDKVIYGIVMIGPSPALLKIPVTPQLVEAVRLNNSDNIQPTTVSLCTISESPYDTQWRVGLRCPIGANRIYAAYELFCQMVEDCYRGYGI
ncbi:hypothetical protein HYPSUDRAFT_202456 [Hypholoma sublateritium FD-334 SS-4]|uniref:Uncharacterized protein n=1 Tax=Hypholoma sublateritium (strain FD-334 SS-4) TaxID=945553 RepID=A0A0D2L500_HYPSF|nr:hypothetical protein HYPSUDRAFT_202456 [Hypholoma sublateritium FD-334 SS-4]